MRAWTWLLTGARNLFRRSRLDRDREEEFQFHVERRTEYFIGCGFSAHEAARRARLEFGDTVTHAEAVRDAWTFRFLEHVRQDIRYAYRALARTPGFAVVTVLSLALGIGLNSAVFSQADAMLLRPLPVRDPGAIVTIGTSEPTASFDNPSMSYANYRDVRQRARSFDGLVAYDVSTFSFAASRDAVRDMQMGVVVSDNFFSVLGVQPAFGRTFTPDEATVPGRSSVVVVAYDLWRGTLLSDPAVVGRHIWINGVESEIVGVAPASFPGMDLNFRPTFFVPVSMGRSLGLTKENFIEDRTDRDFVVKGRLKSGISRSRAALEVANLWATLQAEYPESNAHLLPSVRTELDTRIRRSPPDAALLATLMVLAAVVLLVACANVANLMLGRARARGKEIAVRLALGVSRARLLRQLFTESVLLAFGGGVLALVVAHEGIRLFRTIQVPTDLPIVIDPRLDLRALVFSLVMALLSVVLFGLAPAWGALKTNLVPALKAPVASDAAGPRSRGRAILVVAQVALAMVLLVTSGVLLSGFRRILTLDPGFRTDRLLAVSFDTSLTQDTPDETRAFYRTLEDRAKTLPGVISVSLTGALPMDTMGEVEAVTPEGYTFPRGQDSAVIAATTVDGPYFSAMKTAIVRGRALIAADRATTQPVVVVNEEFAKVYWPGQNPIGKRVRLANAGAPWMEVVGMTRTGKYEFVEEGPTPFLYLPWPQHERPRMSLLVETAQADAAALAAPVRDLVRTIDPNQPVYDVRTMANFYEARAMAVPRAILRLVSGMAALGLLLALVGLYAVVAYSVARRTREIGIRMAIGASRGHVLALVLGQGLKLSAIGIAVGGVLSVIAGRLLAAGLAGLGPLSAATFVIVPASLVALTALATYVPARRASLVDPVRAVRDE